MQQGKKGSRRKLNKWILKSQIESEEAIFCVFVCYLLSDSVRDSFLFSSQQFDPSNLGKK